MFMSMEEQVLVNRILVEESPEYCHGFPASDMDA